MILSRGKPMAGKRSIAQAERSDDAFALDDTPLNSRRRRMRPAVSMPAGAIFQRRKPPTLPSTRVRPSTKTAPSSMSPSPSTIMSDNVKLHAGAKPLMLPGTSSMRTKRQATNDGPTPNGVTTSNALGRYLRGGYPQPFIDFLLEEAVLNENDVSDLMEGTIADADIADSVATFQTLVANLPLLTNSVVPRKPSKTQIFPTTTPSTKRATMIPTAPTPKASSKSKRAKVSFMHPRLIWHLAPAATSARCSTNFPSARYGDGCTQSYHARGRRRSR